MIAVRVDFFFGDADPQPDVAAPDDRLIAIVGVYVEPQPAASLRKSIASLVQPVTGSSAYTDSNFPTVRHRDSFTDLEIASPSLAKRIYHAVSNSKSADYLIVRPTRIPPANTNEREPKVKAQFFPVKLQSDLFVC